MALVVVVYLRGGRAGGAAVSAWRTSARELARAGARYNLVFDSQKRCVRSPSIGECEQLLGMPFGYTAAEGVSLTSRREIVKNAMDVASTAYLLSVLLRDDASARATRARR